MATMEERLRLAEAALTKNGFRKLDDIWVAPPKTGDAMELGVLYEYRQIYMQHEPQFPGAWHAITRKTYEDLQGQVNFETRVVIASAPQVPVGDALEQAAKAIYALLPSNKQGDPKSHPWHAGGNSDMQYLAREMANAAIAAMRNNAR